MGKDVIANLACQTQEEFSAVGECVAARSVDLDIPGLAPGIFQQGKELYLQGLGVA